MNSYKILFRLILNNGTRLHPNQLKFTRLQNQFFATMATNTSVSLSQKERDSFQDAYPTIIHTVMSCKKLAEVTDVTSWIKKVIDNTVTGGKRNRGLSTVLAYKMLEKPDKITEDSLQLACIMGWCVEMLQAYLLILDDIIDGSSTRRNAPCWYRQPEIGMTAINDALLIQASQMHVLKTHFGDHPCYKPIIELFNETLLLTTTGQYLDLKVSKRNKNDYSMFKKEQYHAIVKYKTAFYTYKLPVCLGLYLVNIQDKLAHDEAEKICLEIGKLFQIQDDYIDCYSDESISGKMGTDIQEGKCSWLAVSALERCNSAQRVVFETCYGSKEPAHIERIKQLYRQLGLRELFHEEENKLCNQIKSQIRNLPESMSPELFYKLIDMIYHRNG